MRGYFGALFSTFIAGSIVLVNLLVQYTNPLITICVIGPYIGVMIAALRNASAPSTGADVPTLTSENTSSLEERAGTSFMPAQDAATPATNWETYPTSPDPQPEESDPTPRLRSRSSLEPSMVGKPRGYAAHYDEDEHDWLDVRSFADIHVQIYCLICGANK